LAALGNRPYKIAIFGCDHGIDVRQLAGPDVVTFSLMCAAQLPPSFIEYALRDGTDGVLVTACAENTCEYRLGQRWTAERLQGIREPHLRDSVARERLELAWAGAGNERVARQALQSLRQRLTAAAVPISANPAPAHD
jgi:coenzyme F420-reducing hydrogenase delta subunit